LTGARASDQEKKAVKGGSISLNLRGRVVSTGEAGYRIAG